MLRTETWELVQQGSGVIEAKGFWRGRGQGPHGTLRPGVGGGVRRATGGEGSEEGKRGCPCGRPSACIVCLYCVSLCVLFVRLFLCVSVHLCPRLCRMCVHIVWICLISVLCVVFLSACLCCVCVSGVPVCVSMYLYLCVRVVRVCACVRTDVCLWSCCVACCAGVVQTSMGCLCGFIRCCVCVCVRRMCWVCVCHPGAACWCLCVSVGDGVGSLHACVCV